ncbi:MAG: hypothetical protein ABJL67_23690 [Sulfitobacter sp.]
MMRWMICVGMLAWPFCAVAEEVKWVPMTGKQISESLTGRTLLYGAQWQDFRVSGRTLYFSGRDTWGYWEVRADQYCSMWPPSDLWACYDVARRGDQIRFIGVQGDTTDGVLRADPE